jgi:hypothetical protein
MNRFSQIAKIHRPASTTGAATAAATTTINNNSFKSRLNNNLFQKRASMKNRRLALQMANRPSVQAALKIKKVQTSPPPLNYPLLYILPFYQNN